jgi:hypothetical protein
VLEEESGDGARGGGFLESGKICPPRLPQLAAVGHCAEDHVADSLRTADRKRSDAGLLYKGNVPFLLSWNNMAYKKRNLRDDGLLHCGPAGLSDEEMMRSHQGGHFVSPSYEGTKLGQARVMEALKYVVSATSDDRHVKLGDFSEMREHLHSELGSSPWEEDGLPPDFKGGRSRME